MTMKGEAVDLEIKVHDRDVEKALKVLKRKIGKEGLLKELKNRRHYEKPSVKAKRKRAEARKKKRKALKIRH
jgi:small subunit ribosomal protein S21